MQGLFAVMKGFAVSGKAVSIEPYGCGHINDTYLAVMDNGERYILQRINNRVFPNVEGLMQNILGVTEYVAERTESMGLPCDRVLRVIPTKDGASYACVEGLYYRVYNFIDRAISIETSATPHQFYLSGVGFGKFQQLLDGYPANKLIPPIADFHNTVVRYANFEKAVAQDVAHRADSVASEIEFFRSRKDYCGRVLALMAEGEIPCRVTHNDTKLNNVLIDLALDKAITVIDLDTVMPGSILYDFGDSIRSGANKGKEDEKDLSKVGFDLELFAAYARGFIGEVKSKLTDAEIENMAFGAILMTYECGMRFLTDYLVGDTYFKTHREGHNLDRARTQMKMVEDMERSLEDMNKVVKKYLD